ncbi:MAG: hypothetical protein K8W52_26570 [Deltaproteobacteria bacterium]|nr:hypothetical protein [Deltaproteobacteria bacterium]
MRDLWLLDADDHGHRVIRIDPDGAVVASIELRDPAPMIGDSAQLASGGGALWIAAAHALLYRVTDAPRALDLGHHLDGLAVDGELAWVAVDGRPRHVYRVDAALRVTGSIAQDARSVAIGGGAVWTTWKNTVTRIDPVTLAVGTSLALDGFINELGFAAGALWLITLRRDRDGDDERSTLWRLDPATQQASPVMALPGRPNLIATDTALWLSQLDHPAWSLARVDPRDLTLAPITGPRFMPALAEGDRLWGLAFTGRWADGGTVVGYEPATGVIHARGDTRGHALALAA